MATKDRSKRALIERYADEGFMPPDNWTVEGLSRAEVGRLMKIAYTGCVAAETPRRLGEEAESIDLAGDRFLSKGIANSYWTLWRRLVTAKNAPLAVEDLGEDEQHFYPPDSWMILHAKAMANEEAKRMGRTVMWDRWWEDMRPRLIARRKALATFALRHERMGWGYRIIAGIGSEIEWIDGKFEDFELRYSGEYADA